MWRQAKWVERLILEYPSASRSGVKIPYEEEFLEYEELVNEAICAKMPCRENLSIPNISELEVVRHYVRLSHMSYGVDVGTTPLGSCTMKYNPKVCNEALKALNVENLHPEDLDEYVQPLLEILYTLERWLAEITGMDRCSFQVPAGAAGELAGVLMIKKYFEDKGEERDEILVPDSAHGTNPASAAMAGFKVVKIPTNDRGTVDIEALRNSISERTAGMMLTNPNTLGLFESDILEISRELHAVGAVLYYDGANLNGIMGIARPGDMGFDIVHLNLHKTFSAPHGGGGPGGAVVCAKGEFVDYLPRPLLNYDGKKYYWDYKCDRCIGMIRSYYGNIQALIRTFVYIAMLGAKGIKEVAEIAVLNTNYLIRRLNDLGVLQYIELTHDKSKPRKHEVVLSASKLKKVAGVSADDIAKCLEEQGLHPPITYFPLIVEEALMIELTETEPKEAIDSYAQALARCVDIALKHPEEIKGMPKNTAVTKLDLVRANHPRYLVLSTKYVDEINDLKRSIRGRQGS